MGSCHTVNLTINLVTTSLHDLRCCDYSHRLLLKIWHLKTWSRVYIHTAWWHFSNFPYCRSWSTSTRNTHLEEQCLQIKTCQFWPEIKVINTSCPLHAKHWAKNFIISPHNNVGRNFHSLCLVYKPVCWKNYTLHRGQKIKLDQKQSEPQKQTRHSLSWGVSLLWLLLLPCAMTQAPHCIW